MLDFDVQPRSRKCSQTDQPFEAGEAFYSVLLADGAEIVRHDFSARAWEGPPEDAIGWWKSEVPDHSAGKIHWAPNDVMLHYFEQIAGNPTKEDVRYVLTLLMIRRRILRLEESDDDTAHQMTVYCPKNENTYRVPVLDPSPDRIEAIQEELAELLFSGAM